MTHSRNTELAPYVVVLVHGTFAQGAPWTQPGSMLRRQIEAEVSQKDRRKVEFEVFCWSGENSHTERRRAAIALSRRLRQLRLARPNAYLFTISHSHGGNVVLRALNSSKRLRELVSGAVCISTPYLMLKPRRPTLATIPVAFNMLMDKLLGHTGELLSYVALFTLISIPFTIPYVLWAKNVPTLAQIDSCYWTSTVSCAKGMSLVISSFFALAGAGVVTFWWCDAWADATNWYHSRFQKEWKCTVRRYASFQPDRIAYQVPVLSLSSAFDEARAALRGSWWVHKASGVAVRLALAMAAIAAVAALGGIGYAINQALQAIQIHWPVLFKVADALSTGLLVFAGVALLSLLWLMMRFLRPIASHSSFGAGFPNPETNLIAKVKVCREVSHLGSYTSHRLGASDFVWKAGLLYHSLIYEHQSSISRICEWMTEVAHRKDV